MNRIIKTFHKYLFISKQLKTKFIKNINKYIYIIKNQGIMISYLIYYIKKIVPLVYSIKLKSVIIYFNLTLIIILGLIILITDNKIDNYSLEILLSSITLICLQLYVFLQDIMNTIYSFIIDLFYYILSQITTSTIPVQEVQKT